MTENLLFLDVESYFNSKENYDLRKLSVVEYVRSPKFKVHGVGVTWADNTIHWEGLGSDGQGVSDFFRGGNWRSSVFVSHNIKFDGFILMNHYGIQPKEWRCTKAMAKAVLGKRVKDFSLKTLAEYYGLPSKGTMKTDGIRDLTLDQEKELSEYCLHDVWLCREIYKRLEPDFPRSQYFFVDQTVRMFVEPKLQLNVALLEKTAEEEKHEKEEKIKKVGIEKAIFASNQKFATLLNVRGYEVPTKLSTRTSKRIPALALGDTEFIEMLDSENQELRELCETRKAIKSTLLETRADKLAAIGKTGLWPFDVEFSGATQTHRYSGGNGAGGNPQNFTRNSALREAVEAPKGYKLVVGDFAQIEARLVAYLAKDTGLIEAFKIDPYCEFASTFFGRKITKQDDLERRFGKEAILGLGYGMGWEKFKNRVKLKVGKELTEKEARNAVDLYRKRYCRVPLLWKQLDDLIPTIARENRGYLSQIPIGVQHEKIILPSGLSIQYPNLRQQKNEKGRDEWIFDVWDKNQLKRKKLYGGLMLENICQALTGEIKKGVMGYFGDKVVGEIHDEIILCVPEGEAESYAEELQNQTEKSPEWFPELVLKAEVGTGRTWAGAKT